MNKKVLVIDDDPDLRSFIRAVLEDAGYGVETASDANDLIQLVNRTMPNLIMLDYRLPGINGLMALNTLRSHNIHVPVIMLTGDATQHIAVGSFRAGASDFIPKPCQIDFLQSVVKRVLDNRDKLVTNVVNQVSGYLSHKPDCDINDCSCGLSELVSTLAPDAEGP